MKALFALAAAAIALTGAAHAQTPDHPHAQTRLVSAVGQAAPGARIWVAVDQTLEPGWHTYWRNPGDAGAATTIGWTLPHGWSAGPIVWPAPKRLPLGPIMNYGYEGHVVLPVALSVPANAPAGQSARLSARVDYLVCAQVCVPERADVSLNMPIGAATRSDAAGAALIDAAFRAAPRAGVETARLQKTAAGVSLAVVGPALKGVKASDAYFYPYDGTLLDQAKDQRAERGASGLTLALAPAPNSRLGTIGGPTLAGVLSVDGRAYEVNATPGAAPTGSHGLGPAAAPAPKASLTAVLAAAGAAFLGGLILNLMPCVFPILSMKAAALAGGEAHGRSQGAAFLGGVLAAFATLGGVLLLARAGGAAVGWGFQLQSPIVTAVLALIMLGAALNLSGLFEIGTSLQGLGSGVAAKAGLAGAFFTGVLAVVVAAPCTAPFMGPAVGFALTQSGPIALSVFLALGAGFAAPFTLVAFSPALLRRLPRPGPWMDTFRKLLAFPMYAAAAWLAWVLAQQSGSDGLARLFAAGIALGLAAWLYGRFQQARMAARGGLVSGVLAAASVVTALVLVAMSPAGSTAVPAGSPSAGSLAASAWSPEAVATLQAQNRPVLVNFTAAWCVTCQYNDRAALESAAVAKAFKRTGAAYLVADWTNRNPQIAQALAERGRAGVPLYLVYGPRIAEPLVLPQLLTPQIVARALDQAAGPPA
ncbi:MAG TPA: protein-disulfide reductase DsbD domain-containing protein [Caulobacteraceae bacterium]|jgi:thiol:disulfide interchange protein DsbD|nr:protein-disulfide reductase DsbD domain-containing protein [Caulobacteraceae bacterium]